MKRIKKTLKLLFLVCLIVLAGVGIGLSGGVPIPTASKREEKVEIQEELVETEEGETNAEIT